MNIVSISVGLAGLLIVVGILAMIVSGIKGLAQGKQDFKRIGLMLVPIVAFIIAYFVMDKDLVKAAVMTAALMMGSMALGIVVTGLKGTFKF